MLFSARNVGGGYGAIHIVRDVSFDLNIGETLAVLHHHHLLANTHGKLRVLVNKDQSQPPVAGHRGKRIDEVLDDRGLQSLGQFVDDQQPRSGSESARDGELLLLTARECARRLVRASFEVGKQRIDVKVARRIG